MLPVPSATRVCLAEHTNYDSRWSVGRARGWRYALQGLALWRSSSQRSTRFWRGNVLAHADERMTASWLQFAVLQPQRACSGRAQSATQTTRRWLEGAELEFKPAASASDGGDQARPGGPLCSAPRVRRPFVVILDSVYALRALMRLRCRQGSACSAMRVSLQQRAPSSRQRLP